MAQKKKGFVSGQERGRNNFGTQLLASMERRSGSAVLTRHQMSGQERSAERAWKRSWMGLFRFHRQSSEEQQIVRYESSSRDESLGRVDVHCELEETSVQVKRSLCLWRRIAVRHRIV